MTDKGPRDIDEKEEKGIIVDTQYLPITTTSELKINNVIGVLRSYLSRTTQSKYYKIFHILILYLKNCILIINDSTLNKNFVCCLIKDNPFKTRETVLTYLTLRRQIISGDLFYHAVNDEVL